MRPGRSSIPEKFRKAAVEKWFRNFFDAFPEIHFDVRAICVRDIFAFTGNNVVAVHWDLQLRNREGRAGQNSGVSVITIRGGQVLEVKDFFFDLGEEFRLNWMAGATPSSH
jgi:ketosteroid isomerase-like protein